MPPVIYFISPLDFKLWHSALLGFLPFSEELKTFLAKQMKFKVSCKTSDRVLLTMRIGCVTGLIGISNFLVIRSWKGEKRILDAIFRTNFQARS